ncbi:MAG: sugar transferase [Acidobacteria bacterium]|nr:sugar transferase [Acidobacteriota bacterium]
MFNRQHLNTRPIFIAADILLIWLAFEIAYATRSILPLERVFFLPGYTKTLLILASAVCWVVAGLWVTAYDSVLLGRRRLLIWTTLRQGTMAVAALVLFQYVQRIDLSRPFIALLFAYGILLQCLFRLGCRLAAGTFLGADAARRHILVVGRGETALRLGRLIEANERFGLRLLGFLDQAESRVTLAKEYPVHPLADLAALLQRTVVDEVLFAVESQRLGDLEDAFLLCEEEGVRTRIHIDFFPHIQARVALDHLEDEPLLTYAGAPHDDARLLVKRISDVFLAACALVLGSPSLLVIALVIRLSSHGPVIFRQQRCGLNGRRFTLYKFRTMVVDAESRRAEVEHLNVKKTAFKIPNDPRLTAVGKWLRKFSLDELPQLWNVVRGEMAIVGPRPPVPDEVAQYQRWQRRRLRMRPGLTCLWALGGRDNLDFDDWMRLDLAYIDTWSLALDWQIMLKTVPRVLSGLNAS